MADLALEAVVEAGEEEEEEGDILLDEMGDLLAGEFGMYLLNFSTGEGGAIC